MSNFHDIIANWFHQYKRALPWRETIDPYRIWLSEIILQQTRVDQGLAYYLKFIKNYPDVESLARASEQEVLADWQGLGYYSRARNLHSTARLISEKLNNTFPDSYQELLTLKGIGAYTAAAIASFCFNESCAVVDGNVFRVLSRYFDVDLPIDSVQGRKYFEGLASSLLPEGKASLHNQAIMEFGALQCVPRNPDCDNCPLKFSCNAFANNTIAIRPVKQGKTKIRQRHFHYLLFKEKGKLILEKRIHKDIWQHLFQFPLLETDQRFSELTTEQLKHLSERYGLKPYKRIDLAKHVLSHQHIFAHVWLFNRMPDQREARWIEIEELELQNYPLPQLLVRFLNETI